MPGIFKRVLNIILHFFSIYVNTEMKGWCFDTFLPFFPSELFFLEAWKPVLHRLYRGGHQACAFLEWFGFTLKGWWVTVNHNLMYKWSLQTSVSVSVGSSHRATLDEWNPLLKKVGKSKPAVGCCDRRHNSTLSPGLRCWRHSHKVVFSHRLSVMRSTGRMGCL